MQHACSACTLPSLTSLRNPPPPYNWSNQQGLSDSWLSATQVAKTDKLLQSASAMDPSGLVDYEAFLSMVFSALMKPKFSPAASPRMRPRSSSSVDGLMMLKQRSKSFSRRMAMASNDSSCNIM